MKSHYKSVSSYSYLDTSTRHESCHESDSLRGPNGLINLLSRLTSNMTTFCVILTAHRLSLEQNPHSVVLSTTSVLIHALATRGGTNICENARYSRLEARPDDPEGLVSRIEKRKRGRPLTRDDEGLSDAYPVRVSTSVALHSPEIGVSVAKRSRALARASDRGRWQWWYCPSSTAKCTSEASRASPLALSHCQFDARCFTAAAPPRSPTAAAAAAVVVAATAAVLLRIVLRATSYTSGRSHSLRLFAIVPAFSAGSRRKPVEM